MDDLVKQLKQIAWSYKATGNKECNEYSACTEAAATLEAQNTLIRELVGALKNVSKWWLVITNHADRIDGDAARPIADVIDGARTALTHAKEQGYE